MDISQILAEVMKIFDHLGLSSYVQAGIIITLAVSLLARIFNRGD